MLLAMRHIRLEPRTAASSLRRRSAQVTTARAAWSGDSLRRMRKSFGIPLLFPSGVASSSWLALPLLPALLEQRKLGSAGHQASESITSATRATPLDVVRQTLPFLATWLAARPHPRPTLEGIAQSATEHAEAWNSALVRTDDHYQARRLTRCRRLRAFG
jgi:hypothetical protein